MEYSSDQLRSQRTFRTETSTIKTYALKALITKPENTISRAESTKPETKNHLTSLSQDVTQIHQKTALNLTTTNESHH